MELGKNSWRAGFPRRAHQPEYAETRGNSGEWLDAYILTPVDGVPVLDYGITRLDALCCTALAVGMLLGVFVFGAGFDNCANVLGW